MKPSIEDINIMLEKLEGIGFIERELDLKYFIEELENIIMMDFKEERSTAEPVETTIVEKKRKKIASMLELFKRMKRRPRFINITYTSKSGEKFGPRKFFLTSIIESKLYGRKDRILLDEDGEAVDFARFSERDNMVFPSGGLKSPVYVDMDGNHVNTNEIVHVDEQNKVIKPVQSTFKTGISLNDDMKINMDDAIDMRVKSVYALLPSEMLENGAEAIPDDVRFLMDKIMNMMENGEYLSFTFNYYDSPGPDDAFLVVRNENLYMMTGKKSITQFFGPDMSLEQPDIVEEEMLENLDFGFGEL